jgi:hypothetical protein
LSGLEKTISLKSLEKPRVLIASMVEWKPKPICRYTGISVNGHGVLIAPMVESNNKKSVNLPVVKNG